MMRSLLRRLRTTVTVLASDPEVLLRLPRFAWRSVQEGPRASWKRLRQITHPERFSLNYEAWLAEYHTPTAAELQAMQRWAEQLQAPPCIAVLMPVFNPRPEWLRAAIDSVRAQVYPTGNCALPMMPLPIPRFGRCWRLPVRLTNGSRWCFVRRMGISRPARIRLWR